MSTSMKDIDIGQYVSFKFTYWIAFNFEIYNYVSLAYKTIQNIRFSIHNNNTGKKIKV